MTTHRVTTPRARAPRLLALLVAACQLAGCASPASRAKLEGYKMGCVHGSAIDCQSVPIQENMNNAEAAQNAATVAAVTILLPFVILGAMGCAKYGNC
jgi:hypothetical protein